MGPKSLPSPRASSRRSSNGSDVCYGSLSKKRKKNKAQIPEDVSLNISPFQSIKAMIRGLMFWFSPLFQDLVLIFVRVVNNWCWAQVLVKEDENGPRSMWPEGDCSANLKTYNMRNPASFCHHDVWHMFWHRSNVVVVVLENAWKSGPFTTSLGGGFKSFLFSPLFRGRFPFWLIFFRWVETTN